MQTHYLCLLFVESFEDTFVVTLADHVLAHKTLLIIMKLIYSRGCE